MESLSDTLWDVVISGTGLQQSLLALALSRSGKNILHVDPNPFYGGSEAAFSLQEADEWAEKNRSADASQLFSAAEAKRDDALGSARAYSLALAPQLIHSRSKLVTQLVDSKAFRQIEFLAVGSFYIYQPSPDPASIPSLSRIPSTREDVFSNKSIPARSKRSLMKFLKFVLDFNSEPQIETWTPHADEELAQFLVSEFKLDAALQSYVITLTLTHDGKISVKDGLTAISRHLTSMGVFGAGFAAVYPKWVASQVGCRAAAVGGATYMLGSGIKSLERSSSTEAEAPLELSFTNDIDVKAKLVIQGADTTDPNSPRISRLTVVTKADLSSLFELLTEGAPVPAVAVVAFPTGSVSEGENPSEFPVYAMVHSSDTGECPSGQYVIYLSTICTPSAKSILDKALSSFLSAISNGQDAIPLLYKLYYEQGDGTNALSIDGNIATFSSTSQSLAFDDSILDSVHEAWKFVNAGSEDGLEYMKFEDREAASDDEFYE
ncbi:Rab proteins geranylgeranyltransferase component A [Fusarium culmorum]|uniref:Rab proteins geranylgeranyltransferase n=1 Tax=Fusarium culmorum TaxID=5516 RepID=A0A2T4GL57_FUSCU|nr:Rab proteins geranylgeranyltransferase component A [Fusarium culmorum]